MTVKSVSANVLALKEAIAEVKRLRGVIKTERENAKVARALKKEEKETAKKQRAEKSAAKKAARIAKLEAKLADMKNPVGFKAKRAARKGKVIAIIKGAEACEKYLASVAA